MKKKLIIELSEEATYRYLAFAKSITEDEFDGDCEPSGNTISVNIAPAFYDSEVYAYQGTTLVNFGDAKVSLIDVCD